MGRFSIRNLITLAGSQIEASAVGEGRFEFSFYTKKDMPLGTPMAGGVAGRVFDHADANLAESLRAPEGDAGVSGMLGRRDPSPVGDGQREATHLHKSSMPEVQKSGFAASGARRLYLRFALRQLIQSGAGIFDAETYISTQQTQALEEARVPDSYEDQERSCRVIASPGQGAQARCREAGFPRLVSSDG